MPAQPKIPFTTAHDAPLYYRLAQQLFYVALRLLTRLDIEGLERIPASGPLIVALNHMHMMDAVVTFTLTPRRMTVFAADKWRHTFFGRVMSVLANAIYVVRGEPDRRALNQALEVLRAGKSLGLAPEGTRSRTGGLQKAHNGVVYLATRGQAVVVPAALWGQESTFRALRKLRRADIHVRFAEPIHYPADSAVARTQQLEAYTEEIMLTIARMLPASYRGVYGDRV